MKHLSEDFLLLEKGILLEVTVVGSERILTYTFQDFETTYKREETIREAKRYGKFE